MSFHFQIPLCNSSNLDFTVAIGETWFILGANGTGKSSLIQRFCSTYRDSTVRVSAHRQTWLQSNGISLSPQERINVESNIRATDNDWTARWTDNYAQQRANMRLYDLVDAENINARKIAAAMRAGNEELARILADEPAPIEIINELLHLSGMPISISVHENSQILASKRGGPAYSVAELSDGERNALLIAATVLTAKAGALILIDEPERHLHRSIISPLLTHLFAKRSDCAFIVCTHEVMLPLDNPTSHILLVRGCVYDGSSASAWEVDQLPNNAEIDDGIRSDILGARRKLLFVEGSKQSLDQPLYNLVFPEMSVIAKNSCREVEQIVAGIRNASSLHWLTAFGVVDNDRRQPEDIERLKLKGIYALPVFSVESIYYHPKLQNRVVRRLTGVTGQNAEEHLEKAASAAIAAIEPHIQRLSQRASESAARNELLRHLPNQTSMATMAPMTIEIDIPAIVAQEKSRLESAISARDITTIIAYYPVRETSALNNIASELGFRDRVTYETSVRKLLMDDADALAFVRSLFGSLATEIIKS